MVNIKEFCEACKHSDKKACEDPCYECLERGIFQATAMPLYYEKE